MESPVYLRGNDAAPQFCRQHRLRIDQRGWRRICHSGRVAIGDVQAFIQYARHFSHPIVQTANIANIFQATIAAAERVFEILDEAEEEDDSARPVRRLA